MSTLLVILFLLLVLLYFKCQLLHVVAWTTHSVLLPEPCTPFLGRERELDDLMKLVDVHSGNEERIVSIVGHTGVGKSCLAVQVGHSVIDSGATVSYVDTGLFSLDTLADQVLRSTRSIRERGNNSTQRLLWWLRQEMKYPLVIILDNCDSILATDGARLFQFLEELFDNAATTVKVLITARKKIRYSEHIREYKLRSISSYSSCGLIHSISGVEVNSEDCELIAKITRGIPLSLVLIGSVLKHTTTDVSSVISSLQRKMEPKEKFPGYGTPLDAAIKLSLKSLNKRLLNLGKYLSLFPGSFSLTDACSVLSFLANEDCAWIDKLRQNSILQLTEVHHYHFRDTVKKHFAHLREESRIRERDFWREYLRHFSTLLKTRALQFHKYTLELGELEKQKTKNFLRSSIDCCTEFPSLCLEVLRVLKVSIESQFLFSFYDKDSLVHLVKSTLVNIDVISQSNELVNYREDVADIYAHFALSLMYLQPEEEELISEQAQTWLEAFTGSLHSLAIREFYMKLSVHYRRVGKLQEEMQSHIKMLKSAGNLTKCSVNTCSCVQVSEAYYYLEEYEMSAYFQEMYIKHTNLTTLQLTEALLRLHACQVSNLSKAEGTARKILDFSRELTGKEYAVNHRYLELWSNISAVFRHHNWQYEAEKVERRLLVAVREADYSQVKKDEVRKTLFYLIDALVVVKEYRAVPDVVHCALDTYDSEEKEKERRKIAALYLVLGTAELYNHRRRASIDSLRKVTDLYCSDPRLFNYARDACNAMLIQTHIEPTCFNIAFMETLMASRSIYDFIISDTFDTELFSFYHIYEFPVLVPGALQADNITEVPVGTYCIVFFLKWCLASVLYIFSFRFVVQLINLTFILLKLALVVSVPVFSFFLVYGAVNFVKRVYRVLWIPVWSDEYL